MLYKMYICPNCKYKTLELPELKKGGRYICPKCQSGMRFVSVPGYAGNQSQEVYPLERFRRVGRFTDNEKELEEL